MTGNVLLQRGDCVMDTANQMSGGREMIRKIIEINEEKCNGCGACAMACHEGAIGMVNGKAKLLRDDYCDGLGDCLPTCPTGAISFVEREAAAYDEAAVLAAKQVRGEQIEKKKKPGEQMKQEPLPCGCPGSAARAIVRRDNVCSDEEKASEARGEMQTDGERQAYKPESQLRQWPVQIKLAPVNARWFDGARLLVAADCTAYAYANFHQDFIKGHITLVGCPKLDGMDYADKLTEIIRNNEIRSVTVVRMEVPCCGGIEIAVKTALQNSGKMIPWNVVTITTDGNRIDNM